MKSRMGTGGSIPMNDPAAWAEARALIGSGGCFSVIMPAHGLGPVIAANLRHVHALLACADIPFEIVVVDDGSPDATGREILAVAAELPEIHPLILTTNLGKGAALLAGFAASRGNLVMFLDADLDLPPEQIHIFFNVMRRENADVVIGSKRHPESTLDYPWHRKLMSNVYYLLVKTLFGLPVRDTQTGIKLLRREALVWAAPRMLVKRFAFDLELLTLVNLQHFRIVESPVVITFHGKFGALAPFAIRQILNDTFAIFYRLRILRYYQKWQPPAPPAGAGA